MYRFQITDNLYETPAPIFKTLEGTTSVNTSDSYLYGSGTQFLSELRIGDKITLSSDLTTIATVLQILSNTIIKLDISVGNGTIQTINKIWPKTITLDNIPTTLKAYRKAPVNWNKMQYAFTRNEKYFGLFPSFTASIGLTNGFPRKTNFAPDVSDGPKSWADNLLWTRGINGELNVIISAFDPVTHSFVEFINGVANLETASVKQFQTDIEIISPLFIQDILNKDSIEFDYQSMIDSYSVNHLITNVWQPATFVKDRIYGIANSKFEAGYNDSYAVYPYELFERLIRLMTGFSNAFYSSVFARAGMLDENGVAYPEDGALAYNMITTGRFIRGYASSEYIKGIGTINVIAGNIEVLGFQTNFGSNTGQDNISGTVIRDLNNRIIGTVNYIEGETSFILNSAPNYTYSGVFTYQSLSDNSSLIISFEKLFKHFSVKNCLGMTIKTNNYGNLSVSIEPMVTFYNNQVTTIISDPKDIEITFDETYRINELEVGYNKYQKNQDNVYGNSEFNNKVTYNIPSKYIKKKFSLTSDIRCDSTGIQLCLESLHTSGENDPTQNEFDNEIFCISSFYDGTRLRSTNNTGITVSSGSIYGNFDISKLHNYEFSPVRILKAWGSFLRIMQTDLTKVFGFQKAEELTRLSTLIEGDSAFVSDCSDVEISSLTSNYLSSYKCKFNSPLGIDDIINLQNNPYGLIKVWNYITNQWSYGWIKEVSSEPIDKKTNWELILCSNFVTPIERKWKLKMLSGKYFQLLSGGDVLLINQN